MIPFAIASVVSEASRFDPAPARAFRPAPKPGRMHPARVISPALGLWLKRTALKLTARGGAPTGPA